MSPVFSQRKITIKRAMQPPTPQDFVVSRSTEDKNKSTTDSSTSSSMSTIIQKGVARRNSFNSGTTVSDECLDHFFIEGDLPQRWKEDTRMTLKAMIKAGNSSMNTCTTSGTASTLGDSPIPEDSGNPIQSSTQSKHVGTVKNQGQVKHSDKRNVQQQHPAELKTKQSANSLSDMLDGIQTTITETATDDMTVYTTDSLRFKADRRSFLLPEYSLCSMQSEFQQQPKSLLLDKKPWLCSSSVPRPVEETDDVPLDKLEDALAQAARAASDIDATFGDTFDNVWNVRQTHPIPEDHDTDDDDDDQGATTAATNADTKGTDPHEMSRTSSRVSSRSRQGGGGSESNSKSSSSSGLRSSRSKSNSPEPSQPSVPLSKTIHSGSNRSNHDLLKEFLRQDSIKMNAKMKKTGISIGNSPVVDKKSPKKSKKATGSNEIKEKKRAQQQQLVKASSDEEQTKNVSNEILANVPAMSMQAKEALLTKTVTARPLMHKQASMSSLPQGRRASLHTVFEWNRSQSNLNVEEGHDVQARRHSMTYTPDCVHMMDRRKAMLRSQSTTSVHQFHVTPQWPPAKQNGKLHARFYARSMRATCVDGHRDGLKQGSGGVPGVSASQMLKIMEPCSRREMLTVQGKVATRPVVHDSSVFNYSDILDHNSSSEWSGRHLER